MQDFHIALYGNVALLRAYCESCHGYSFINDNGSFGMRIKNSAGRERLLTVHFDHAVPFSWTQDNKIRNIVAACNVCNGLKRDLMFDTVEQCREYLALQWRAKRYATIKEEVTDQPVVPTLRKEVPTVSLLG